MARGRPVQAAFVYANPRASLEREVAAGFAPDTGLLGENHLGELGIASVVHDPLLTRKERHGVAHRLTWYGRELLLPFELGSASVACTPLALLFPLAARLRRRLRVLVFNLGLCGRLARASRMQRRLLGASLGAATAVVCFASAQSERLIDQTGLDPDRVHTVRYGVDDRFYTLSPLPPDGYVLSVGRDLARDYATLARAVEGLSVPVVLVTSRRNLEGITLPGNVDIRIDVSYRELRELYAGARCVVIPTRAENYPFGADCSGHTVLLEAMATGRPVVLSTRSTNAEYVRDGETALQVPPENPEALRETLHRVLDDEQLASALAGIGRQEIERQFTSRHLAQQLASLIRRAAT